MTFQCYLNLNEFRSNHSPLRLVFQMHIVDISEKKSLSQLMKAYADGYRELSSLTIINDRIFIYNLHV